MYPELTGCTTKGISNTTAKPRINNVISNAYWLIEVEDSSQRMGWHSDCITPSEDDKQE
jgi:hypothetical protein